MAGTTEGAANRSYPNVIEPVFAKWLKEQSAPLVSPVDGKVLDDRSGRITDALLAAGRTEVRKYARR